MTIIVKKEHKRPYIITIPRGIAGVKKIIGNDFEVAEYKDVLVMYDKNQDNPNIKKATIFKELELKGTIVITGNDTINGDMRSLSKKEINHYFKVFRVRNNEKENEI